MKKLLLLTALFCLACTREYVVPIHVFISDSEDAEVNLEIYVIATPTSTTNVSPDVEVPVSVLPKSSRTKSVTKHKEFVNERDTEGRPPHQP